MAGYVVVGSWGETAGPVPWPQISPPDLMKILTGKIPIVLKPIGPGPLVPEQFVDQMNEARNSYIATMQDIGDRMDSALKDKGGVGLQVYP